MHRCFFFFFFFAEFKVQYYKKNSIVSNVTFKDGKKFHVNVLGCKESHLPIFQPKCTRK